MAESSTPIAWVPTSDPDRATPAAMQQVTLDVEGDLEDGVQT